MTKDRSSGTILLVEDEALVAMTEQQMLEAAGYSVMIASNGEAAREIATDAPIDLILMDINLGSGISGIEAARSILTIRDIPILFLTSSSDAQTIEKVQSIPHYGYVLKSSGRTILLEVIHLAFARAADRAEVKQARDLYQSVVNLTGDIITRHDADGNWVYLNERAREVWGVSQVEPASLNYFDYIEPEDRAATEEALRTLRKTCRPVSLVNRIHTVDGWRIYQWNSAPVIGSNGEYRGLQSTGRDITAQKAAEERIHGLLEERDLLMREVHHRVKNDLSFVYSLLSLQASQTTRSDTREALSEASDRVRVLTDIYRTLTASDTSDAVSVRPLLEKITDNLSGVTVPDHVSVTRHMVDVTVPVRLSVAIGIIYNELLTNSAKYAVSTGTPETPVEIAVSLRLADRKAEAGIAESEPGAVALVVHDSGPGFPQEVLDQTRYGFGLTVVQSLVAQHEGTLTLENSSGAGVTVTLPKPIDS
ncbi:MAG TPA: histidine kinase dimerization/phosphoacceptor domain -containing protein [Alkalispirochaeta sp.]|nr:histidine kinase dimerization/phosphoacceptor domain -containing protein [Alkalispirochaeta sp.]